MDSSKVLELYEQCGGILTCNIETNKCVFESTNLEFDLDSSITNVKKFIEKIPSDKIEPVFKTTPSKTYKIGGYELVDKGTRIETGRLKASTENIFEIPLEPKAIGIKINTLKK
jgi:hypothetical protein